MRKLKKSLMVVMAGVLLFSQVSIQTFAQEDTVEESEETTEQTGEDIEEKPEVKEEQQPEKLKIEEEKQTDVPRAKEMEDEDPESGRANGNILPGFYDGVSYRAASGIKHDSRFNGAVIEEGIDVSKHNGTINWTKVKQAGIDFAIIRVAYRGYGNGKLVLDTKYKENLKNAIAAGIPVGVYIFSQAITTKEAIQEADYILNAIKGYKITLPVVMDFEYASDSSTGGRLKEANLSKAAATNVCMAFGDRVKSKGYTPMVYANKSMLTNDMNASTISAKYPIWLAHYTTKTNYAGDYTFWQYTSSGKVSGISGRVDRNFQYITKPAKVSGCSVVSRSATSIGLKWKAVNNAAGYRIYRRASNGSYVKIGETSGKNAVSYTDRSLSPGRSYTYKVRAFSNIRGKRYYGTSSDALTGSTVNAVPAKVTGAKVSGRGLASLKLIWNRASGVSGYRIYRKSGSKYVKITDVSGRTSLYIQKGLTPNKSYTYKVRAYNVVNGKRYYGTSSAAFSASTKNAKPSKVTGARVSARAKYSLKLTWKGVSSPSGYRIYRKSGKKYVKVKDVSKNTRTYVIKNLSRRKKYTYKVRAYKIVGGKRYYGTSSAAFSGTTK